MISKPNRGLPWTPEVVDELQRLVADGVAARHIARRLGRTEEAVRNKARKEGLSFLGRTAA